MTIFFMQFDVLSGVSFSMQPLHRFVCSPRAISPRLALHCSSYPQTGSPRTLAHVDVRPIVQMLAPSASCLWHG
jgi:hypothetical protein